MIALLCAVQAEMQELAGRMTGVRTEKLGSKTLLNGQLAGRDVLLCAGGMGKANAAHAATLLFTRSSAEALIIFGIGGAYPSTGAQVGDIALARSETAGDEGVLTAQGFQDTEYIGIPLLKLSSSSLYNTFPAPDTLLLKARGALTSLGSSCQVHIGSFVTLSTCTGTSVRARELEARYDALCENMEGAAAAQVAELHSVPWLEIRGISNIVEDRDLARWDVPLAARTVQQTVLRILEGWAA